MSKPKVFISHYMPEVGVDMIREHCEIDYYSGTEPLTKSEFIARASQADAVLAFVCDYIDEDIVVQCPRVQVISSFGKGFDNIDVDACTRRNILVTVNPDALTESTADLAIGLLLSVSRNILNGDRHVRGGQFQGWHATHCLGKDFHNSKLGIIGFGAIGQAIARRAKGFDTTIRYYDVVRKDDAEVKIGASYSDMAMLLAESDFIVVAVDLRPDNVHLLGREQLRMMNHGSYLINISRGSIVDEAAIAEALQQGSIQGYAADVFEFEDRIIPDRPEYIGVGLLDLLQQTVFTPHIGTGTLQARDRLAISSATQLLKALQGDLPSGAVNGLRVTPMIGDSLKRTGV
jgi:lactate dehydrogenase-like 2-hydroxyacid dehydrogenase